MENPCQARFESCSTVPHPGGMFTSVSDHRRFGPAAPVDCVVVKDVY